MLKCSVLNKFIFFVILFFQFSLHAESLKGEAPHPTEKSISSDPYENFNRKAFKFNKHLDRFILLPIAKAYSFIVPSIIRNRISFIFLNLKSPVTLINDLLQGRFYWLANDSWRFIINTSVGIGGLFDVADEIGLQKHDNFFGLTLSAWTGQKDSVFILLPVLGPVTLIDSVGLIPDYFMRPETYYFSDITWSLFMLEYINLRARWIKGGRFLNTVFDPYIFIRDAYLKHRDNLIWINKHPPIKLHDEIQ